MHDSRRKCMIVRAQTRVIVGTIINYHECLNGVFFLAKGRRMFKHRDISISTFTFRFNS